MIPPYDAIALVRGKLLDERPAVAAALRELVGRIDQPTMQELKRAVDQDRETPVAVAARYLESWP